MTLLYPHSIASLLISVVDFPRQSSSPVPETAVGASVCGSKKRNPPSMKGWRWFQRNHWTNSTKSEVQVIETNWSWHLRRISLPGAPGFPDHYATIAWIKSFVGGPGIVTAFRFPRSMGAMGAMAMDLILHSILLLRNADPHYLSLNAWGPHRRWVLSSNFLALFQLLHSRPRMRRALASAGNRYGWWCQVPLPKLTCQAAPGLTFLW